MKTKSRIDKDNYYLNIAEEASKRSTCLKKQYGAVIVNNKEIISTGYNGAARGVNSCLERGECNRENSARGTDYHLCYSVHAEMNAIISASRRNMINSTLYLVGLEGDKYVENPLPCSVCRKIIVNAGIAQIIIRQNRDEFTIINTNEWESEDLVGGY